MSDLFVARQSGTVMLGGRRHAIRRGVTVAEEGSEILRAHRKLFEPMRVHYPAGKGGVSRPATATRPSRPVEQATAVPGERRPTPEQAQDPARPPLSGPGSGTAAWRDYAAAVTGEPAEELAKLSRDELIGLVS